MQLPPLTDGRILCRYQRFLADLELADGTVVTAHVPNTGTMATCWEPLAPVQLSRSTDPRRKLAWSRERVDIRFPDAVSERGRKHLHPLRAMVG